jgi:hypothetical protein
MIHSLMTHGTPKAQNVYMGVAYLLIADFG